MCPMWVLKLYVLKNTSPHIVTESVHLEVALEGVPGANLLGQSRAHAAIKLL